MANRGVFSRDRLRRDLGPSWYEDSSLSSGVKRGGNPPSRHLWVGNLAHSLMERDLTDRFLQFGDLDTVAFQHGRSYCFINFKNDDDAIAALKALQGIPLAGNPLRIEFAKADKSTVPSRDEEYRRDDQRSTIRGSPFSQKDPRFRNASPDPFYGDKSKISDRNPAGDKNAEPSEVLWIGFPASIKVDEMILRKAFSPFGELEKVTAFLGRSYAFVRFRNIVSACRAKETLQGKLFGNPRVHICFSRNEGGSSSSSGRAPLSPRSRSNGHLGAPENFRNNQNSDSDSDVYGFNRKGGFYPGSTFDNRRFEEELGPPPNVYERRGSPPRERGPHFDEFSQKIPRKASYFEEPWDLAEDSYPFHGSNKKMKTGNFAPEDELPEYSLSELEEKRPLPRGFLDFSPPKNYGYTPQRDHDNYQRGPGSMHSNPAERKRFAAEPEKSSSLKLWKWEGTIAKGGTPVCHAHAFPVGKSLDMMLPEFLDCTARTGLDMLAKHYYQAASAWVVFFAPASDADIGYYNEFMHYLEEKQRAAVAKLDDKTTLFLVPPSDFSEKVLRVPGKLCISGVILRLELPTPNFGSLNHGDPPNINFPPIENFANLEYSGSCNDNRHNYPQEQRNNPVARSNWSTQSQPPYAGVDQRTATEDNSSGYYGDNNMSSYPLVQENKPLGSVSLPISGLQPQQLVQLASSLLGKQAVGEDIRQQNTSQMENQYRAAVSQSHGFQGNQMGSEIPTQREVQQAGPGNSRMQNTENVQEGDGDPQNRLQATLQLAAALLQQIQQGKGT